MSKIQSYKDLIVWQKSIQLVKLIYSLTEKYPKSELFGLINQMRRAAVSIPSNIAEGYARKTQKDTLHFQIIAFGSALEVETQLHIGKGLGFADSKDYVESEEMLMEIIKMLNKLTSNAR